MFVFLRIFLEGFAKAGDSSFPSEEERLRTHAAITRFLCDVLGCKVDARVLVEFQERPLGTQAIRLSYLAVQHTSAHVSVRQRT